MPNIHAFLSTLRDLHPDMARYGLNGGCFRVYLLLKQVYPQAEPYYNGDHVITLIDGDFYDIRGRVEPATLTPSNYTRMDSLCFNRAYGWDREGVKCPESTIGVAHGC